MPVLEQVLKQFPLRSHAFADKAARASAAAHASGRFWALHDLLFKHYRQLDDQKIEQLWSQAGLDAERYQEAVDAKQIRTRVADDLRHGREVGVRGTPTVFVNGKRLRNSSQKGLQRAIEKALE